MRLAPAAAVGFLVLCPLPTLAYTAADARACMSDAFRLCAKAIPNQARVTACLQAKQDQLSAACAEAFERFTRTDAHKRESHPASYND